MSLGLDNFNTRFESLYAPMGNIQANYGIGNYMGNGYGPSGIYNSAYGRYGMVIDPLMGVKTREGVIQSDQYINNYHGRPIPADVPKDDVPTMLGILGTALGATALAIAAFRTKNKKAASAALNGATNAATGATNAAAGAANTAAGATNAAAGATAQQSARTITAYQSFRPYVRKHNTIQVDPSTLRYAPQPKGTSTPVTVSSPAPAVNQQAGSVTGGAQNNSASSGLVSGGYANATVLNPKSTIVPGVEKPSNINPNFIRTHKTTPANQSLVSGGYADATVINPKSTIVPGVEKPSNINPNFVRTAKTTPANQSLVSGGYADAVAINPKSAIVPGVEKPSNINPNFVKTAKNNVDGPLYIGGEHPNVTGLNQTSSLGAITYETPAEFAKIFRNLSITDQQRIFHTITNDKPLALCDLLRAKGIVLPENVAKQIIDYTKSNIK